MIVLPKYKDLYVDRPIEHTVGLKGEFKCVLIDEMGNTVLETPWSDNTIYDAGLDLIATTGLFTKASIGDDNTATVEAGPNQLGNRIGPQSDTSDQDAGYVYAGGPSFAFSKTVKLHFNAGTAMTVREIGIHPNNDEDNLYSRNLVVPEFAKTTAQVLDIYYRHTYFPPLGDVIQTDFLIDGILYDTEMRGCNIDRAVDGENGAFAQMSNFAGTSGGTYKKHYDGDIGLNTEFPSGTETTAYGFPLSDVGYTPGNFYRDQFIPMRLQDGNLSTGKLLRSTTFIFNGSTMQVMWKLQSDPTNFGIPKDNTKTLDLTFRQSWVRHVP